MVWSLVYELEAPDTSVDGIMIYRYLNMFSIEFNIIDARRPTK